MLLHRLGHKFQGTKTVSSKSPYLDGLIPSTVFDLDATIAASYGGSGVVWSNLTAYPADGADRHDYDFVLGDGSTSSTFPTLTGSVGDPGAYWHMDGNDFFRLQSGNNTAFLANLHKASSGQDFWIAAAVRLVSGGNHTLLSTRPTSSSTARGLSFDHFNNNFCRLAQHAGSGGANFATPSDITVPLEAVFVWSHSRSGNQSRLWLNSASPFNQAAHTFAGNEDTTGFLHIGSSGGDWRSTNNTQIYSMAMGNEYLDSGQVTRILSHLRARHKRAYDVAP